MRNNFKGIVLAAGFGTRLGRPKATVECLGSPLIERAAQTLTDAGCNGVVAVVGPTQKYWHFNRQLFEKIVENPKPEQGQGSSVFLGAIEAGETFRLVVLPVDNAMVSVEMVKSLIDIYPGTGTIVKPAYKDRGGHPMIIANALVLTHREMLLSKGLRALQHLPGNRVLRMETADQYCVRDIDHLDDYFEICGSGA